MDMYGKLFNGGYVRFSIDEYTHAQHLLMDGGTTCDCADRGVESRNGKFRAIAFRLGISKSPVDMHGVELNPGDVVEMHEKLDQIV